MVTGVLLISIAIKPSAVNAAAVWPLGKDLHFSSGLPSRALSASPNWTTGLVAPIPLFKPWVMANSSRKQTPNHKPTRGFFTIPSSSAMAIKGHSAKKEQVANTLSAKGLCVELAKRVYCGPLPKNSNVAQTMSSRALPDMKWCGLKSRCKDTYDVNRVKSILKYQLKPFLCNS